MTSRSVTGANTGLSFLDVLAGAVGAVVLLFIAFAALPVATGAKPPRGGSFVRMEWTVRGDPSALVRLLVRPPGNIGKPPYNAAGEGPYFVDLKGFANDGEFSNCRLPGTVSHSFLGFESSESPAARLASGAATASDADRQFVLRLHYPMPGKWQIDLVYFARSDGWASPSTVVDVSTEAAWSKGSVTVAVERLRFGDFLAGPAIDVAASGSPTASTLKEECPVQWYEWAPR